MFQLRKVNTVVRVLSLKSNNSYMFDIYFDLDK